MQSMPCKTKGVKAKRQSEKTVIVKILCHAILAQDKGCDILLMSVNKGTL